MQRYTVDQLLQHQAKPLLGHLLYVVHHNELVFYVGQSKRHVAQRFLEHVQHGSYIGQFIELNRPQSLSWLVDFYTLTDCRPFIAQKSLFALQAWESFDMDMAEQALIAHFRPALNRDFNPRPTPLPTHYRGGHLSPTAVQPPPPDPQHRLWLNRMSLAGWVYSQQTNGRLMWQHRDGRCLSEEEMAPFQTTKRVP